VTKTTIPEIWRAAEDRANRKEVSLRRNANLDEVKVLIDNYPSKYVLLAVNMNVSILSVQDIHDHTGKYVSIPKSWRSKNYGFEFVECINACSSGLLFVSITSAVQSQYRDFRFLMSEKFKSGLMHSFDGVVQFVLREPQFGLLSRLLDIYATFQASSTDSRTYAHWRNAHQTNAHTTK